MHVGGSGSLRAVFELSFGPRGESTDEVGLSAKRCLRLSPQSHFPQDGRAQHSLSVVQSWLMKEIHCNCELTFVSVTGGRKELKVTAIRIIRYNSTPEISVKDVLTGTFCTSDWSKGDSFVLKSATPPRPRLDYPLKKMKTPSSSQSELKQPPVATKNSVRPATKWLEIAFLNVSPVAGMWSGVDTWHQEIRVNSQATITLFSWTDKRSLCRFTLVKCQKGTWPCPFIKCQQPVFFIETQPWIPMIETDTCWYQNFFFPFFLDMFTKTSWILRRVKLYLIEIQALPTISSFFAVSSQYATGTLRCTHYDDSCQAFLDFSFHQNIIEGFNVFMILAQRLFSISI